MSLAALVQPAAAALHAAVAIPPEPETLQGATTPVALTVTPMAGVCLLAKGVLPHRPSLRPMAETPILASWRRAQDLPDTDPVLACDFDGAGGQLHPGALRDDWLNLCVHAGTPMLVYLHRGHNPDPRCPLLQDLLQMLDHRGSSHALRVETRAALHDAVALCRALAAQHGLVLALYDPTRRLIISRRAPAPLRYMLLASGGQAERLRALAPAASPRVLRQDLPPAPLACTTETA